MPWSLVIFGKAAREAGNKILFWAHGFHSGTNWLERLARLATPDLIIANSRFTAGGVRNLFPHVPGHVMYYPVALVDAPEAARWRAVTRNEQGVDERTAVIIQVGRLEEWKGHLLHLQALSLLQTAAPWVCWIVGGTQKPGEEQYLRRLQETAIRLGIADRVRFLGQRSDVDWLLAGADIFCQPNQGAEPFGIVFVEALWAGRPVVTTAMGGPLEIIDSSCGLLVEPGNPSQLAASLGRLIESPELRSGLGQAGSIRALKLCDPATQMKSLSALVRSALGGSR